MDMFTKLFMILLATVGIIAIAQWIMLKLLKPGGGEKLIFILPVSKNSGDVELLIRGAVARARWICGAHARVTVIDYGMEEETMTICRTLSRDIGGVDIITREEACSFFNVCQ